MRNGLERMLQQNKSAARKLPQIPAKYRIRVQNLIKKRCANYDKTHCLLLDDGWMPCVCPQFSAHVLNCKYFRTIVLPDDPELCGCLLKIVPKRTCILCGRQLYSTANATKYCPACAKKERRRREAERMRKRRSSLRK